MTPNNDSGARDPRVSWKRKDIDTEIKFEYETEAIDL